VCLGGVFPAFLSDTYLNQSGEKMFPRTFAMSFLIVLATLILDCCPESNAPDLLPVANPPFLGLTTGDYCRRDGAGNLIVTVANTGGRFAPGSITTVTFLPKGAFPGATVELDTPALVPGGYAQLQVQIPAGCTAPCKFTIEADAEHEINERGNTPLQGEGNNDAKGACS
jgi:hypothetical protein